MYTSLYTSCFATIDQYLISSRSVRIRQLSKLSSAKLVVSVSTLIWMLINIPELKLYQLYPKVNGTSTVCTVYSSSWSFYYTYFQSLIFLCIIPIVIYLLFSLLTYRNLCFVQQNHQLISIQMRKIVLLQSTTMFLSLIVASVQIIYVNVTMNMSTDALRTAQENLFNTFANLFTYVYYIGGFYIYFISSKVLRVKLFNIILNRNEVTQTGMIRTNLTQNQIQPINTTKV